MFGPGSQKDLVLRRSGGLVIWEMLAWFAVQVVFLSRVDLGLEAVKDPRSNVK